MSSEKRYQVYIVATLITCFVVLFLTGSLLFAAGPLVILIGAILSEK